MAFGPDKLRLAFCWPAVQSWVSANQVPTMVYSLTHRFSGCISLFHTFVSFKTSKTKTNIDSDKISEEIFRSF